MKSKGLWVHKNSKDIFYEVIKIYNINPRYIKVKYNCWNINEFGDIHAVPGNPYNAKVFKDDLHNWRRYVDSQGRI